MNKIKSKWRRLMNIVKINGGSASGGSAGGWVKYVTESGRDSEHSPTFPTFSTLVSKVLQILSAAPSSNPYLACFSNSTPAAWTNSGSNSLLFKAMASWIRMSRAQKPEGIIFSKAGQLLTRLTLGTGNRARVLVTLLKRSASWRHRVSVILRSPS